jgi:hypothetical protein
MCPDPNDSEDSDDENEEEIVDEAEREEENVDPEESEDEEEDADDQEDDEDTDEADETNRPATPFGLGNVVRDMQAALDAFDSINIYEMIDPAVLRILNDPDFRRMLAQPAIDPEMIRQIQQPAIDPDLLQSIQPPAIDPEVIRSLSQPAIDPELIETLQTLNDSTVLELYQTAAALEQLDQESVDELGEEPGEELEDEFEDGLESPEQGGFLSTFFNGTAAFLLQQPDQFSDESVHALRTILESESVQAKTDAFQDFVSTAGNTASQVVLMAVTAAFHLSWGMHFADELDSDDDTTEEGEDEMDEDQDRGEG